MTPSASRDVDAGVAVSDPPERAPALPDRRTTVIRLAITGVGIAASVAAAEWAVASRWDVYLVFFVLAFAFSFVWADSESPTSVPYMVTATAFIYIGGAPILTFELLARLTAYPLVFAAAERGWLQLPLPLKAVVARDRRRAWNARLTLGTLLGLATIGSLVRLAVVHFAHAAGVVSPIGTILLGEVAAYGVMGLVSASLPLPSTEYVASPLRLPTDDERVDVIFSAVLIVPFLVLLVNYGYLMHGLPGAAAWSIASLAPHGLVQLLVRRRTLLVERTHQVEASNAALDRRHREVARSREDLIVAYRDLQAAQGRLLQSEKLASLGQLVAGVAHEINNPISFIVGNLGPVRKRLAALELAVARGDTAEVLRLSQRIAAIFDTIGRGAERTAAIVQDLRTFSRLGDVERAACDVNESLEVSLRLLKPKWDGRITVERDYGELPELMAVRGQLNQVFMNLLANACDAIPDAGTIRVTTARDGADVCVTIADTGAGIADEHLGRIFDPFFTTKDLGRGTGLGLSISHGIVEDHGGRIEVESRAGVGTRFTVRLPIDGPEAA